MPAQQLRHIGDNGFHIRMQRALGRNKVQVGTKRPCGKIAGAAQHVIMIRDASRLRFIA